jgi:hypothetical protein
LPERDQPIEIERASCKPPKIGRFYLPEKFVNVRHTLGDRKQLSTGGV